MPTEKKPRIRVLFVCTGNSCRSQMAEGLLQHIAGKEFEVHSGGTRPWILHPLAVKAMKERKVDISDQYSKSVDNFLGQSFDYVITVCDDAKETCPVFPGQHTKIHWSVHDPVNAIGTLEERMKVFRRVRDDLEGRIREWLKKRKEESAKA